MNDALLVELYSKQPISVDSLADTNELYQIASIYRVKVGDYSITDQAILKRLIHLRKKGLLALKSTRSPKPQPTGWPPYTALRKSDPAYYEFPVVHKVGFRELVWAFYTEMAIYGDKPPLSRAESYDVVKRCLARGYIPIDGWPAEKGDSSDYEREAREQAETTVRRLFPELCESPEEDDGATA